MSLLETIAVIVMAWLIWRYLIKTTPTKASGVTPAATPTLHQWPALGEYDLNIVGESFHQNSLKKLAGAHGDYSAETPVNAVLIPYSTNPKDKKAVRVEINSQIVGHLSRDDARAFRKRLESQQLGTRPTICNAIIVGGGLDRKTGKNFHYGVRLDLAELED